jgi:hypothetical protein
LHNSSAVSPGGNYWEGVVFCGEAAMRSSSNRYFTVEQLEELAVAKYIEAALTPEGQERNELLEQAMGFADRARMKSWLMGEMLVDQPARVLH